jgi:hypothetical protein
MIQFNFTGSPYPSFQQQEEDKTFFLDKLGPFKNEFDAKEGIVTFNYSYPPTDTNRIAFVLGPGQDGLSDFIVRWNEYIRGRYGNAS